MDNNISHDNEVNQKSELEEKEVQNEEEEIGEHDMVIEEDFQINMEIAEISNPQPLNDIMSENKSETPQNVEIGTEQTGNITF